MELHLKAVYMHKSTVLINPKKIQLTSVQPNLYQPKLKVSYSQFTALQALPQPGK